MSQEFRSGFVAIIGKPNVGKSTILNALLGQKLAIVSEKPETTRDNIRGVLTTERAQAVFIDTPGIHKPHLLLGRSMVKKAKASLFDADILLLVLEVASGLSSEDFLIIDLIKEAKKPAMVIINKIDAVSKGRILPMIDEIRGCYDFLNFIPISALKGDNMLMVKEEILRNLPRGDKYYPDEQVTDKDDLFQAQEIIREKLLSATREEVPHSIAVKIERFARRPDKDIIDIEAVIYVERESQKGIIIGKKGDMAKRIGVESRQELEKKFNNKIFLRTWVKVLKNWRKDPRCLKILGVD